MAEKCNLCGGRLANGICMECGMNNRKSDEQYQSRLNQTNCRDEGLSHVHEGDKAEEYKAPDLNKNREPMEQRASKTFSLNENKKQKKHTVSSEENLKNYQPVNFTGVEGARYQARKNKRRSLIVVAVIGVLAFAAMAQDAFRVKENTSSESVYVGTPEEDTYDPYEYVSKEIPAGGEDYSAELEAGFYAIGFDIPEGIYTIEGEDGMTLDIQDEDSLLSVWKRFGKEEYMVRKLENMRLFNGGILMVEGGKSLQLKTENGQVASMVQKVPNPVKEEFSMEGTATAGVDFPAGVYDISSAGDEFGVVNFEIDSEESEANYGFSYSFLLDGVQDMDYPEYCRTFRNVVLPEGTVINSEDLMIKLVPSATIISENYAGYYDNI